MARSNKNIGSRKLDKVISDVDFPRFDCSPKHAAYRKQRLKDFKPEAKYPLAASRFVNVNEGPVNLPILFHVVYTGELDQEDREEIINKVSQTISLSNDVFQGDLPNTQFKDILLERGYVSPIDNPDHGIDANIRLVAADRIPKKDVMPFLPRHSYEGFYMDLTDVEGSFAEGIDIPDYATSSYTEEDIQALRHAYETAEREAKEVAKAALEEAEADYYLFLDDTPGVLFYQYNGDLSGNYEGGDEKLNAIRDLEAGEILAQGNTPGNLFKNEVVSTGATYAYVKFLESGIFSKLPCINVFTNTQGIIGGPAGDSGLGTLVSNLYQNNLRVFSLDYDLDFMSIILPHEILHSLGVSHSWEVLTMRGNRGDLRAHQNDYPPGRVSRTPDNYEFDYPFLPPFVYNDDGDSYEYISEDEKIFVENIVNTQLIPASIDSPIFTDAGNTPRFTSAHDVDFSAYMLASFLPTFWGGSYVEVDGVKKLVINPTQSLGRSSRTSDLVLPEVGDFYGGGIVLHIDEEKIYITRDLNEYLSGNMGDNNSALNIGLPNAIGSGLTNTQSFSENNSNSPLSDECLALDIDGYDDWYIPSRDLLIQIQENVNALSSETVAELSSHIPFMSPNGLMTSVYLASSSTEGAPTRRVHGVKMSNGQTTFLWVHAGTKYTIPIRHEVIADLESAPTETVGYLNIGDSLDGGIIYNIDDAYINASVFYQIHSYFLLTGHTGDGNPRAPILANNSNSLDITSTTPAVVEATAIYDMLYTHFPEEFNSTDRYGFSTGLTNRFSYNPITQDFQVHPLGFVGLKYALHDSSVSLPEVTLIAPEVPADRKGPRINIYNPVCKRNNPQEMNIAFGLGLGWYDPTYPKFPENTLAEDMFSIDNCPCLYTEQSYQDTDSEGNVVTKTFTVFDINGEFLNMSAFRDLAHIYIDDAVKRVLAAAKIHVGNIFLYQNWFTPITTDPYEFKVPNFLLYTGFSKDSVIPYNIKASLKPYGSEFGAIGNIQDTSLPRALGKHFYNITQRYYFLGSSDPTAPDYNPFKVADGYVLEPHFDFFSGETMLSGYGNIFDGPGVNNSAHNIDTIYGPIDYNCITSIMHYYDPARPYIPIALTKGQAENTALMLAEGTGKLGRLKDYSNLVGYNSEDGPVAPVSTAVKAQDYMDDAVQYVVDYDVSIYQGGCTDPDAPNYNPNATISTDVCVEAIPGCTNPTATNYDPNANTYDGSCFYYSLDPIPLYAKYVCNDNVTPVCNLYDPSNDITETGEVAEIYSGVSIYQLNPNNATSLLGENGNWTSAALTAILPFRYSCEENPLAAESEGPENLTGGCVNIEDNSLCEYPSVDYFHCSILEAGEGLGLLEGYMTQEDYTMTCASGGSPTIGRSIVSNSEGFFIIGSILLEDVLFTASGVAYKGKFIRDLDGTLYEFTSTNDINRDNPLFFRNQISIQNLSQAEKDLKNLFKIKESLNKIINFTH